MTDNALVLIVLVPLVGAVLVALMPQSKQAYSLAIGLFVTTVTFIASLQSFYLFDATHVGYQFVFDTPWIERWGVHFKIGVDGISLWFVIATTFLLVLVFWYSIKQNIKRVQAFTVCLLLLEASLVVALLAIDLLLFYFAWEIVLLCFYFLIGIWGGTERIGAAMKFLIYSIVGSLLLLAVIIYIYVEYGQITDVYTFDLLALRQLVLPKSIQAICFLMLALSFAIKIPLVPFHTWLPSAYVEAPTIVSIMLASKFGVYGLIRFAIPLFPQGAVDMAPYLATAAVISILYGALLAYVQKNAKTMIAYASIAHLGFCVLGVMALNQQGIEGAIFAMLVYSLMTAGLFFALDMLFVRRKSQNISDYGGLWTQMPVFCGLFLIIVLGNLGLPSLAGFIGEFLILIGMFDSSTMALGVVFASLATVSVIITAVYLLSMFNTIAFGKADKEQTFKDIGWHERSILIPIVALIFILGIFPNTILNSLNSSVDDYVEFFEERSTLPLYDEPHVISAISDSLERSL